MPHLVTALFENSGQAQRALQALLETGMTASRISIAGIPEGRTVSSISGFRTLSAGHEAVRELRELSLPEEDLHAYARALQRGRTLVAVQASGQDRDETIRILEMFEPIELEDGGRAPEAGGSTDRGAVDPGAPLAAGLTGGAADGLTNTGALPGMGAMAEGSDLGTADLRTDDARQGGSTLTTENARYREEQPGVDALRSAAAAPGGQGRLGLDTARRGPVRSYEGE